LNEWQGGLWERLQAEVNSTLTWLEGVYDLIVDNPRLAEIKQKWDRSGLDMADLLTTSSRDPQLSLAFNYASLLMNNSFFLEGLVSPS
jgi:Fe-Mn family superoxide dismutase